MNGFRNWFSRLMVGRYGNDEFNRFLLIAAAVLILIGIFVPRHWMNVVVVILLAIVYGRMFSKNHAKRQQENMKYLEIKARFTGGKGQAPRPGQRPGQGRPGAGPGAQSARNGGQKTGQRSARKKSSDDGKRIYICPYCKGSLKVPVGAGKIRINCPHCGKSFEETV